MPTVSPKSTNEVIPLVFNFSQVVSSIDSTSVSVTIISGTDSNPSNILDGTPEVSGGNVTQYIKGGINNATYNISMLAIKDRAKYELTAIMTIKPST